MRLLAQERKQDSATGISKRNLYSGCWKLAPWLLVSRLPGIPASLTQALGLGRDLTLAARSDYSGQTLHHQSCISHKMAKPLQRRHNADLQQFKIDLKWMLIMWILNDCSMGIPLNLFNPQNSRKSAAHLKRHFASPIHTQISDEK